jgi:hypothetical protein
MVEHVVLFRWTEEASQEEIEKALLELSALKSKIAGILDSSFGANFSERAKGYTHGLVMRFTGRAALEAFYPHPEHQRVLQDFLNAIRVDTLAFDYEIQMLDVG